MKRFCVSVFLAGMLLASGLPAPRSAHAGPELLVVEVSEQDVIAADRLLELTVESVARARLPAARDPARGFDALRSFAARRVVVLDTERQRVYVLRAGDSSVLTRNVEPKPNAGTPYVMAFVAHELLGLSAELEPSELAREARPAEHASGVALSLRAGAEFLALGEPFALSLRPAFGAGVTLAAAPGSRFSFDLLLECALLGHAQVASAEGHVELGRSDARLRAGIGYRAGRYLALGAFVRPYAALTHATYSGPGAAEAQRVTLGLGLGLELDVVLAPSVALFASPSLDLAAGRSEYRARGIVVTRDPAQLFAVALGVAFFESFQ